MQILKPRIVDLAFFYRYFCFAQQQKGLATKEREMKKKTFTYLEFSNLTIIVIHSSSTEIIYATRETQHSAAFPFAVSFSPRI